MKVALLLVLLLTVGAPPASPQGRRSTPQEQFFNLRWDVERDGGRDVAVVGSLDNHYLYPVTEVLLHVQVLDPRGQVLYEGFGPVNGTVPPGGRITFRVPLAAEGAQYAVLVHAFQFGRIESP